MDITMGERIRLRRQRLGYTIQEVASKMGTTTSTLAKWERGDTKTIKSQKLAALAKVLDCSPLWLMGIEDDPLLAAKNIEPLPQGSNVPIIGTIACGSPIFAEENWEGLISAPDEADFALRVKGDSMINARIFPGDLIFVKQQSDVENGEIAAVLIENEATLKRVFKYPDRVELRPENPLHKALIYEGTDLENLRILGKAISIMGAIK